MDKNMFYFTFILFLCSLPFIDMKSENDDIFTYLDPSNANNIIEFLAKSEIDIFSNMNEYMQYQLDRKEGTKNKIPYMNVVSWRYMCYSKCTHLIVF